MCRIAKSTCAKHQTEEAFCQMVKTPSFLHHSRKRALLALERMAPVCVADRKELAGGQLVMFIPPWKQMLRVKKPWKSYKWWAMTSTGERRDPPRIMPCSFPSSSLVFLLPVLKSPPAPAPWRGLLWPPVLSSLPSLPSYAFPSEVLTITRNYCTGLLIGLGVLAFCLSSPVNQKLWEDWTMSVLLVTVSPKLRTVHGRQEV